MRCSSVRSAATCYPQALFKRRTMRFVSCYLYSSASSDHHRNCQGNELKVFPERLVLQVINIHFDHILEGHAATSIDLPDACQTWFSRETQPIAWGIESDFVGKRWTWPNQRHFPP